MIKLDWDKIAFEEADKRICYILQNDFIKSVRLYQSSSMDGYHALIETLYHIHPVLVYRLRREWLDDGERLVRDVLLRKHEGVKDVLFGKKLRVRQFGKIVESGKRTPMFLYFKNPNTNNGIDKQNIYS